MHQRTLPGLSIPLVATPPVLAAATLLLLSTWGTSARGEQGDWAQFHGPGGQGVARGGHIPNSWTEADYHWTTPLEGQGIGSPVIFQDRVYVLNAVPDKQQRSVECLSLADGHRLWQATFPLNPHPLHPRNTFASSTPFVDESGVYVAWADPARVSLVALSHDGQVRWNRDLGTYQSQHGFATSPVILEGRLILFNSQQADQLDPGERAGQSRMQAFEPATGKTLWETSLTTTRVCYGVPTLRKLPDGTAQVVAANTGDGLFGLDLRDGKMQWKLPVFSARCVSSPLIVGELVIASAGAGGGGNHLVAVRPPQGSGQATEAYRVERGAPYVPTPVLLGERLYMVDDKGIASAVDGRTGDAIWSRRLGGNFGASPIVVGDKMLAIDLDGQAHVLRTGESFKSLGDFALGGPVQATPACGHGNLILRIGNTICCLRMDAA